MIRTYQYRLVPTRRQHRALESILESQRILYNAALEERIGAFRRGVVRTCFDQYKALTELRKSDDDFTSIPANIQRATLQRLDEAYKGFFRRIKQRGKNAGFPRFRGKGRWNSFGFREFSGIRFDGVAVRFKGIPGGLKVHLHRPLPSESQLRSCIFRRDIKGWKVGFAVCLRDPPKREGSRRVGVDLGITTFAMMSDGTSIPSLRAARRAQRRMRIVQRSLARKRRGSNGHRKAKLRVARCAAATARARLDHLHKASARIVRDHDEIAVERLNLEAMARGLLARDVRDASWGKFLAMLRYKAEGAGARVVEVNCRNTSQDCSGCGARVRKRLSDRRHDCMHCGLSIDRDLNAARNILDRAGVSPGLRNVAGYGMRAGGNLSVASDLPETVS